MFRPRRRHFLLGLVAATLTLSAAGFAQKGAVNGEWRVYGGDAAATRYSPLDQINRETVKNLQVAWTWKFDNYGTLQQTTTTETTPLMVDGVLYFTAGPRRTVVAADAATGETLWVWRPDEGERYDKAPRKVHRGVAYWTDGTSARILVVTPGFQLVELDAKTGEPVAAFGQHGIVDLFKQLDNDLNLDPLGKIGNSSPPVVIGDVVVVGPALLVGTRVNKSNVKADVMAFNVRTGKKVWDFHTIPRKDEPGYETWENHSADYTGNAGVWGPFSADPQLGIVYLSVENATNDVYGGARPGANLYANSIVAVDAKTGKQVWHYQLIHHDIWDYDTAPNPILVDLTVDGRPVKALVQFGKQAFAYVFDRTNGKPVWPIVEKPVPQSDVAGEKTYPTQPFPSKPPAFDRQGITESDLIDFTPELHAEALQLLKDYHYGGMYTPGSLVTDTNKGTVILPGYGGGANWTSGAADPETGFVYVGSVTSPNVIGLKKNDPAETKLDSDYVMAGTLPRVHGLSIIKPPYGRITAYNMNRGEIAWQIPNGDTPPSVKNNPVLKGLDIPKTGSPSQAGLLVTKTLLFAGEGPGGQAVFHAYDKATGAEVWQTALPGPQTSLPMTYMDKGRQYIVFAVRGNAQAQTGAELVAFALPEATPGRRVPNTARAAR